METYNYPHFSNHRSVVHVALYSAVANSARLRERIIKAATTEGDEGTQEREAVNFAFIDARLVTSRLHLETAVYQAVLAESQGLLRTKTVHSEILWALNPTNNITEAIRRYGVSDASTALLVVRITGPELSAVEVKERMDAVVQGSIEPLAALEKITDWAAIKKHYKLNNELAIKSCKGDVAREHKVIDNIVVSSVAMKSVMA